MTKDCADSRAVATFGLPFAANAQSILSMQFEPCQSHSMRFPGQQKYSLWLESSLKIA